MIYLAEPHPHFLCEPEERPTQQADRYSEKNAGTVFVPQLEERAVRDPAETLPAVTPLSTYCRCAPRNTPRQRSTSIGKPIRQTAHSAGRIGMTAQG
jgi:hypothetical protein